MSEWWFNAVSATKAIFTARTCYSFNRNDPKYVDVEICKLMIPLEFISSGEHC